MMCTYTQTCTKLLFGRGPASSVNKGVLLKGVLYRASLGRYATPGARASCALIVDDGVVVLREASRAPWELDFSLGSGHGGEARFCSVEGDCGRW